MKGRIREMFFSKELKKLNLAQRQAVESIEGPVMVIAGPGTGKTQILAMRIASILQKTDTEPEQILAITFTEAGVSQMRKRLLDLIGSEAYRVSINTFHGFANAIILEHPDSFPGIIGRSSLTEIDQILIVQDILEKVSLKLLRPFGDPLYYVRSIVSAINELKREGVDPKIFRRLLEQEAREFELIEDLYHEKGVHSGKMRGKYQRQQAQIAKNQELQKVYAKYQEELAKRKRYDYADMINEVVKVLEKDRGLLFLLQESFQYVLIDEHQDTNKSQNRLVELLMGFHKSPNLFVVGDEKQAIFRFQGASLENFLYFKHRYKDARLITLTENYRSQQVILDAAGSIHRSLLSKDQKLRAQAAHKPVAVEVAALQAPEEEHFFIARHIAARLRAGAFTSEVAVLYRDNKDATGIARMLERLEVPFIIESDQNIFEDEDIRKLLALLRAVNDFGNDALLLRALHADFLQIDSMELYQLVKEKGLYQALKSKKEFRGLYEKLSAWQKKAKFENVTSVFEVIVSESGFLSHILSLSDSAEKLEKLNGLFDEIKVLVESHGEYTLKDFLEYLDILEEHKVLVKKIGPPRVVNRVRLMTAHKSKGQEFSYVYIAGAYDGHWGSRRSKEHFVLPKKVYSLLEKEGVAPKERTSPNKIGREPTGSGALDEDDERSLFYVALTRAKKEVVISYAKTSSSGREQLVSKFVAEIPQKYLEMIDVSGSERAFSKIQGELLTPLTAGKRRIKEKDFLRELFGARGFSVTALNNYLKCPWQYFYVNLLRIPEAKNRHMMFGTAVHAALKDFFDAQSAGKKPTKKQLLSFFEVALRREPLLKKDFQELLEKGAAALGGYFEEYKNSWKNKTINELKIRGVHLSPELYLTGALDKMEILDKRRVKVVDYKTAKPKSRNEILGQTKQGDGDYYRQLVFYKLLLSLYKDGAYEMVSGEIDFIEPDSRGKFHKEVFEISDKEVADLRKEVERVFQEIWELKFWDTGCKEKDCRYCELRSMMG